MGRADTAAQARRCFEVIEQALGAAGANLSHMVRTRMFLTDVSDFPAMPAVRKEFVGEFKPVDTIVQVAGFVNPEWRIEVEADAVIPDARAWRP